MRWPGLALGCSASEKKIEILSDLSVESPGHISTRTNVFAVSISYINPLTLNDVQRRLAVSPLKIKISSKKSRQAALRRVI
jgi:hypothetical protein